MNPGWCPRNRPPPDADLELKKSIASVYVKQQMPFYGSDLEQPKRTPVCWFCSLLEVPQCPVDSKEVLESIAFLFIFARLRDILVFTEEPKFFNVTILDYATIEIVRNLCGSVRNNMDAFSTVGSDFLSQTSFERSTISFSMWSSQSSSLTRLIKIFLLRMIIWVFDYPKIEPSRSFSYLAVTFSLPTMERTCGWKCSERKQ